MYRVHWVFCFLPNSPTTDQPHLHHPTTEVSISRELVVMPIALSVSQVKNSSSSALCREQSEIVPVIK